MPFSRAVLDSAELGHVESALALLSLGAKEHITDDDGRSAFVIAEQCGHLAWVEAIKKMRASMLIQGAFRGMKGRSKDLPARVQHLWMARRTKAAIVMQCFARRFIFARHAKAKRVAIRSIESIRLNAVKQIQRYYRGLLARRRVKAIHEHNAMVVAAKMLQRVARGISGRAKYNHTQQLNDSAIKIQKIIRAKIDRKRVEGVAAEHRYWNAVAKIHYYMRRRRGRIFQRQLAEERTEAATVMQAAWRGRSSRRMVRDKSEKHVAAKKIQGMYRVRHAKGVVQHKEAQLAAAVVLQKAYLRHIDWSETKRQEAEHVASVTVCQAVMRQLLAKKRAAVRKAWQESGGVNLAAAMLITRYIRRHSKRLTLRATMKRRHDAARVIQRASRGFVQRIKFRNMIRKRNRARASLG